ncbi:MAG: hypothetical protein Q9188_001687 [Gyalolechia gomerana]
MSKMSWSSSTWSRRPRIWKPILKTPGIGIANLASAHPQPGLKINQDRLLDAIHTTSRWGQGPRWGKGESNTGVSRLALSDSDKDARDWFVHTTKSLGCHVKVDAMGNIFAVRPGRRSRELLPTCAGSHLDTQPTGGRYDGILGVCAGLEMLKVLHEEHIETDFPVGVVNWTNIPPGPGPDSLELAEVALYSEEGARFPISMVASGVWAGKISLERAHNLKEVGNGRRTMKQELDRIGYLGPMNASYQDMPLGGPRLEAAKQKVGVVQGVQAYRASNPSDMERRWETAILQSCQIFQLPYKHADFWHTISVYGQDCHTGTTDFANRADALLTAAKLILHSHNMAARKDALASTGIIRVEPGSTNTVPGRAQFSLDIRAGDDNTLMNLEEQLKRDFYKIAEGTSVDGMNDSGVTGRPCSAEWTLDAPSSAVQFDSNCIDCVRQSAEGLLGQDSLQDMISGAGGHLLKSKSLFG